MVFLPSNFKRANLGIKAIEKAIRNEGQELIGWRDVPVDKKVLGDTVKDNAPSIKQFFVKMGKENLSENEFSTAMIYVTLTIMGSIGLAWSGYRIGIGLFS